MTSRNIYRIAILGAGNVGQALAAGWRRTGHSIVFGVRDPNGGDEKTVKDAVAGADTVVLAIPFSAAAEVLAEAGDCAGKLVIDCTNPLAMSEGRLALSLGFTTSGAEEIRKLVPKAHIVKTLNQTGAENLAAAVRFAAPPAMFIAGDDVDAVAAASALVADLGFEPIAAGLLVNARLLEPLAMLWIDQALTRGAGRDFALQRIRRPV